MAQAGEVAFPLARLNRACKVGGTRQKEKRQMERQRRAKFSLEVRSGTARFRVRVQARGIREARRLVGGGHPQGVLEMAFPTQAGSFFVPERTHDVAA
jgi:hypothetical protein